MMKVKQGSTVRVPFRMVSATDNKTPAHGLSPIVRISKDGGSFAVASNSPASSVIAGGVTASEGWYTIVLTATETNTAGPILMSCYDGAGGANIYADTPVYVMSESDVPLGDITDAAANKIADAILKRSVSTAFASSDGDTLVAGTPTLLDSITRTLGRVVYNVGTGEVTVYGPDGTTQRITLDMTTGAGPTNPVIGQTPG